jgi:hypothetical protein
VEFSGSGSQIRIFLFTPRQQLRSFRPLVRKYQEVARTVFLTSGDQKRKLHVELQDKVIGLYTNIRLFQKGVEKLPGVLGLSIMKDINNMTIDLCFYIYIIKL